MINLGRNDSLEGLSLGKLRNLAVEECRGDYVCQWYNVDWYHRKRLEEQMRVIITWGRGGGCVDNALQAPRLKCNAP